jgi:hypothetical protein
MCPVLCPAILADWGRRGNLPAASMERPAGALHVLHPRRRMWGQIMEVNVPNRVTFRYRRHEGGESVMKALPATGRTQAEERHVARDHAQVA